VQLIDLDEKTQINARAPPIKNIARDV